MPYQLQMLLDDVTFERLATRARDEGARVHEVAQFGLRQFVKNDPMPVTVDPDEQIALARQMGGPTPGLMPPALNERDPFDGTPLNQGSREVIAGVASQPRGERRTPEATVRRVEKSS